MAPPFRVKLPNWRFPDEKKIGEAVTRELYKTANEIMNESKSRYVPVDTGTLRSSGTVDLTTLGPRVTVELGYGGPAAPYALYVHENPRAGKTHGVSPSGQKYRTYAKVGQWKFLTIPFEEVRRSIPDRLRRAAESVPRKTLFQHILGR